MSEADAGTGDNAEFDNSFEEFSVAKGAAPTGAAPGTEGTDDNEEGAEGADQGSDKTKTPEQKNEAADDAAATAAGNKGEDGKDGKDGEQPSEVTLTEEQLAKADPAFRSAYEALQRQNATLLQQESTHKGRLSAQDRLNHLAGKMERLKTSGANSKVVSTEVKNYLESDSFKDFKEKNPELAEPFEALAATFETVAGAVADDVQAVVRETRSEVIADHGKYILEQHPDYGAVVGVKDPKQAKEFGDWVKTQPNWVQKVYRENSRGIVDGVDVVEVVDRYKRQHPGRFKKSDGEGGSREPAGDGKKAGAGHGATNSDDDAIRNRRKEAGAAVHQKGGAASSSSAPNEFDKAFDHFAGKQDQHRQGSARR